MKINGALTLGENIGDLGGLTIAYDAYQMHVRAVDGGKAPVIDGFSGDQRFFLAWAQLWRDYTTPAMKRQNLLTDPHSPGEFRANGRCATSTPGTPPSTSARRPDVPGTGEAGADLVNRSRRRGRVDHWEEST